MVLDELIAEAWRVFDCDAAQRLRVKDSMPILFFGNYDAYQESDVRIVTVGLNPSAREFPEACRYKRFPTAKNIDPSDQDTYLAALSAYFGPNQLNWFYNYAVLLEGMSASYRSDGDSTALHTDICSPVATATRWGAIPPSTQRDLMKQGVSLWHQLLKALQPHVVIVSIRSAYLTCIEFFDSSDCHVIRQFDRKKDGSPRRAPYLVKAGWSKVGDETSLFIFGNAGNTPFQPIDHDKKRRVGAAILRELDQRPSVARRTAATVADRI